MSDGLSDSLLCDCGFGILSLRKPRREASPRLDRRTAEMRLLSDALAGDPRVYPVRSNDDFSGCVACGTAMGFDDGVDED